MNVNDQAIEDLQSLILNGDDAWDEWLSFTSSESKAKGMEESVLYPPALSDSSNRPGVGVGSPQEQNSLMRNAAEESAEDNKVACGIELIDDVVWDRFVEPKLCLRALNHLSVVSKSLKVYCESRLQEACNECSAFYQNISHVHHTMYREDGSSYVIRTEEISPDQDIHAEVVEIWKRGTLNERGGEVREFSKREREREE